jgi:glycosyltransferase involved in cell wall biosynthesis
LSCSKGTPRILEIIDPHESFDATSRLALLVAGVPREQFDIHVAVLANSLPTDGLLPRDAKVSLIDRRWAFDPRAFWRLKNFIEDLRPALVHTWGTTASTFGRAAALAASGCRLIASEAESDHTWPRSIFEQQLDRRTDVFVTPTAEAVAPLVARGVPRDKIQHIAAGVAQNPNDRATRQQLLDELGLPSDSRLMGTLGPLVASKRIKDLVWAADLLKVFRDDVHLLVIGEGPHRWRLERFRDQVRIGDKVHFLGNRADVRRILPCLDVFWLASRRETLSHPILEAMAAGLPVVSSDISANRQLVLPGETGYLVPLGDRAGLARWGGKVLNEPALAARFSSAARARAEEYFPAATMIESYAALYRQVLGAQ